MAGGFALAIIMVPLVARATQEVLAARARVDARGEPRARRQPLADDLGVVLPTALGGILTGAMLAIARAAGETAPLLFTTLDLQPTRSRYDPRTRCPIPMSSSPVGVRPTRPTTRRPGPRRSC